MAGAVRSLGAGADRGATAMGRSTTVALVGFIGRGIGVAARARGMVPLRGGGGSERAARGPAFVLLEVLARACGFGSAADAPPASGRAASTTFGADGKTPTREASSTTLRKSSSSQPRVDSVSPLGPTTRGAAARFDDSSSLGNEPLSTSSSIAGASAWTPLARVPSGARLGQIAAPRPRAGPLASSTVMVRKGDALTHSITDHGARHRGCPALGGHVEHPRAAWASRLTAIRSSSSS